MAKKYPGYDPDNTKFDEYFRKQGLMTNNEFFTSNGPGGFYEGMVWDSENEEWVLNAENQRRADEAKYEYTCRSCEQHKDFCECPTQYIEEDEW